MSDSPTRRLALIESQLRALATRQERLGERSMSKHLLALADQITEIAALDRSDHEQATTTTGEI